MVILSIPRLVVLGCSYPFIQDIGPGLSLYTVGTQGKIGPHKINSWFFLMKNNISMDNFFFFLMFLKEMYRVWIPLLKMYNKLKSYYECNFKKRFSKWINEGPRACLVNTSTPSWMAKCYRQIELSLSQNLPRLPRLKKEKTNFYYIRWPMTKKKLHDQWPRKAEKVI